MCSRRHIYKCNMHINIISMANPIKPTLHILAAQQRTIIGLICDTFQNISPTDNIKSRCHTKGNFNEITKELTDH